MEGTTQLIEGIDPKITELLAKTGIKTFAGLSAIKKSTLKNIGNYSEQRSESREQRWDSL